jgi:hypothetical protein
MLTNTYWQKNAINLAPVPSNEPQPAPSEQQPHPAPTNESDGNSAPWW